MSTPYSANGNGILQGSGPQFASIVPGVPLYASGPIAGVTQPGTIQWLNPNAFVSAVDPSTGACSGGDTPQNCQFGTLGRNALRGPDFFWSDFYLTKWFPLSEHVKLRFDVQCFNVFNHPNFALPSNVYAGIPGQTFDADRLRRAHLHDVAADRASGRWIGRRQQSADDRLAGASGVLSKPNLPGIWRGLSGVAKLPQVQRENSQNCCNVTSQCCSYMGWCVRSSIRPDLGNESLKLGNCVL